MARIRRDQVIAVLFACAIVTVAAQDKRNAPVRVTLGTGTGVFHVLGSGVLSSGTPISLDSDVEVEQKISGIWKDARVANLKLVSSCASPLASKCVPLAAGTDLQPVAWRGSYCYSQCPISCDLDGQLPAGTYRFVVYTCGRKQRFASPEFQKK